MTRLLAVLLITFIAFMVAAYTWNRAPQVECTPAGLVAAGEQFATLAEKHPSKAAQELMKLANRTRADTPALSIDDLIQDWISAGTAPDPRTCRRLKESLVRLR